MCIRDRMGTRLDNPKGPNLYEFWREKVTKEINETMKEQKSSLLVNLASNEYFGAVDISKLDHKPLDITFKEYKDGKLKFISFNAKKARGYMSRYICKNQIKTKEDLKGFDYERYSYSEELSTERNLAFVR